MADHIIDVKVANKIASVVGDPLYVCGNSDYTVKFDFDAEWADHETKTARFVKNNREYVDVMFTGDQCSMPILENTPSVRIGVYAGNLCTTTAAVVNAQRSILCGAGAPADPPADVYTQMMTRMDDIFEALPSEEVLTEIRTNRESAEASANSAAESARIAKEVEEHVESVRDSIPETFTELSEHVGQLSEEIGAVVYTAAESTKRGVQNTWTGGYLWVNGSAAANAGYAYSDPIDVLPGDVISCVYTANNTAAAMRFIEARNGDAIVATENNEVTSYTVPDGVTTLRVNVYSSGIDRKVLYVERSTEKAYPIRQRENFVFSQAAAVLPANTKIKLCDHVDNKKNYSYLFTGYFDDFSMLEIGHGTTEYGAVYLRITDTDIQTIAYNGTVYQTFQHGLTLRDFIMVNIKGGEDIGARAEITIRTNGGSYTTNNVIFFGCNGAVYAVSQTAMTGVVFDYVVPDMQKDVFIFGDSYTSLADNMKFPYYLLNRGYTNYLIAGFGGATASNGLLAFREICDKQKPKYVVWLLGMNNPDNGAINASWLSCTETVIAYCEEHKIIPILATIPNTPVMENIYKNQWVRESGHRYVDFAKAVGAEASGSAWYAGMLYTDNVHPSSEGAKVLAERILMDVPEIAR